MSNTTSPWEEDQLRGIGWNIFQDCLIVTVQSELEDRMVHKLREEVLKLLDRFPRGKVIIDLSGVQVIDPYLFAELDATGQTTRLVGAETVLVGIRPDVSSALAIYGCWAQNVLTAVDVEHGRQVWRGSHES